MEGELMGPASDFSHIPIIDVSGLVAGGTLPTGRRRAPRRSLPGERLLLRRRARRGRGAADPAARPQPGVLRAGPRDQAADPHGPGGPGLAGLLPRRRRADLRPAGPEGGPVLRGRTAS